MNYGWHSLLCCSLFPFLIASSWLSIKVKPDFAFRDGKIEKGLLPPPCHLDVFWGVGVTSSEWYRSSYRDKKAASNNTGNWGQLVYLSQWKITHSWLCCNGAAELVWMLGLGCSADGTLFVCIMLAAFWCLHISCNAAKWFEQLLSSGDRALKPTGSVLTSEMLVWLLNL